MTNQVNPVYQHTQTLKDATPRHVQGDLGELVKVLADAISANRLPTYKDGGALSDQICKMAYQNRQKSLQTNI